MGTTEALRWERLTMDYRSSVDPEVEAAIRASPVSAPDIASLALAHHAVREQRRERVLRQAPK